MNKRRITLIDIFSGAGGFSAGFLRSQKDIDVLLAIESDVAAAATFKANHPNANVYNGKIESWLEEKRHIEADIVVGGPPCQGFSTLGKRKADDPRNSLWEKYVEFIHITKPKYFVLENVASFLKSSQYQEFVYVLNAEGLLRDYAFDSMILDAANFGVAQSRKRAIVIGWRKDVKKPNTERLKDAKISRYKTFRESTAGIQVQVDRRELPSGRFWKGNKKIPGPFKSEELHLTRNLTELTKRRISYIGPGGNRFSIPEEYLPKCWKSHNSGSSDVMGRLFYDRPSVTIRTEFFKPEKGRYLHPVADRPITHHEAARLQGFSDSYLWCGSKTAIAKQIGNAVPVDLASAIADTILEQF
ncbi:DNA cytosine methyltransferase [Corynebacterium amycolatum]|uniref:Cytosine-specific methyltransferase n=1 Tax=Corynebacterium amycolatum TaxID=43765 RepID=A0AB38XTV2_CORAY|nr:DNA cytosine methyltransferase [Corynebacterium amycolatum]MBC6727100.1 DNA (cytosine-5-)-methyltransferase [Corynebacterium amycolatum]QRP16021.1 DNA cytosine methyltransferase [Corynebacterium amycolatum]WET43419.1 DNA cytosine methyltransferase [Corynebacterium amycolatum]